MAALLAVVALAFSRPAARRLKEEIESAVGEACDPCQLKIGELSFGLSPPGVIFSNVKFEQGDPRDSAVAFDAARVVVPVSPSNIGKGPWKIGLVRFSGLDVTVHEGDLSLPKKTAKEGDSAKPLEFECEGVEISAASFTYRKDSSAGAARIRLPELTAEIQPFGSYGPWLQKEIVAQANAQLESSGKVKLTAKTLIGVEGPWADVDLSIQGLNLKEMNSYFRLEEGVTMGGKLLNAHGTVEVRNTQAAGRVEASYEGLDLMFHSNRHRGGLSAILTNLGVAIKVNKGNSGEPRKDRAESVVTKRHAKESVVSFILRTMKEAVLRVAT